VTTVPGRYIAIEGVIGVGKTSLAKLLSERLHAKLILEEPEANPFLEDFYKDPRRYAFQTQMYFLVSRYRELKEKTHPDLFHEAIVSDYLFQKDRIFANLNLSDRELDLYDKVEPLLEHDLASPDLVVYLQASPDILVSRIQQRGRAYEKLMEPKYIATLVEAYNYFFFHYTAAPLLVVNTNEMNFVHRREDLEGLVSRIETHGEGIAYVSPGTKSEEKP
jgi:deoxyguanosine kinase